MAKVQFGGGVSNMQGSIAGNTFTRSKAGPAARNRVKPNNPATPAQMAQRALITRLSKSWQGMTDAQRTAWDTAASQQKRVGVCGNAITLTGHQYYVRSNSMREENNDTADANEPPAAAEFTADIFSTTVPTADISDASIKINLGSGAADTQQITIWATAARSAGKRAYKGVLKKTYVTTIDSTDVSNTYVDIYTSWTEKFGAIAGTAGKAITFSCRQYDSGTYSPPVIVKAVITA